MEETNKAQSNEISKLQKTIGDLNKNTIELNEMKNKVLILTEEKIKLENTMEQHNKFDRC